MRRRKKNKISYIECVSYQVAILEDEFGVRHEYFVPADAEKAAGRRPHLNTMPGTHGTPEFIADLAADIYQLHTPNYREGIRMEMAMTYLTIIETAKMWGLQVKEYLTYVWREVMSGNTDYESMTPEVVIAKQNS